MRISPRAFQSDMVERWVALGIAAQTSERAVSSAPPSWCEDAGVTEKLLAGLRVKARVQQGRDPEPSAGILGHP